MAYISAMGWCGNYAPGTIIDLFFMSGDASHVPATLGGVPVVSVYKANSDTQSTTGVTLAADADSITGFNRCRIDTSADGTFYAAGSNYAAVITTGTIGAASAVGFVVATFSLRNTAPNGVRKNTALAGFSFLLIADDHITPKTGATVVAERSIDGAAFASCSNSVTEVSGGLYKINLAASDLNGDVIALKFSAANADTRFLTLVTQT